MRNISITIALCCFVFMGCAHRVEYLIPGAKSRITAPYQDIESIEKSLNSQVKEALDRPLRIRYLPLPAFPKSLSSAEVVGKVTAGLRISSDGVVREVKIFESPDPRLSQLVESALLQWRFEPITRNNQPTTQVLYYHFAFKVED
jgi:TonB family protein